MGRGDQHAVEGVRGRVENEGFEHLVEQQWQPIQRFFARWVQEHVAEDLTAETFAQVWAKLHEFDPARGSIAGWVQGYASRVLQRHRRDHARQGKAMERLKIREVSQVSTVDFAQDIVEQAASMDQLAVVREQLAALSAPQRLVLVLHVGYGIPCEALARMMDMAASTVRSHLRRGRMALAKGLDRALGEVGVSRPGAGSFPVPVSEPVGRPASGRLPTRPDADFSALVPLLGRDGGLGFSVDEVELLSGMPGGDVVYFRAFCRGRACVD